MKAKYPQLQAISDCANHEDRRRCCHLLDEDGRALCFADVAGNLLHAAHPPGAYVTFHEAPEAICAGCGRERCPVCAEIDRALERIAA
jgi:hypothetical protein